MKNCKYSYRLKSTVVVTNLTSFHFFENLYTVHNLTCSEKDTKKITYQRKIEVILLFDSLFSLKSLKHNCILLIWMNSYKKRTAEIETGRIFCRTFLIWRWILVCDGSLEI